MTLQGIKDELTYLVEGGADLHAALKRITELKQEFVKEDKQEESKRLWCYEEILKIHILWEEIFTLIKKEKKHYDAWCKLEQCEISLSFLNKHYSYEKNEFQLKFIEKCVNNLQAIYPYRVFISTEILEEEMHCSICNAIVSIKRSCGHKLGEIYNGELCHRVVTKGKILGMAVVENPAHKYAVMFISDPETGETKDHYNYEAIDFLFNLIESPYDYWDLEIHQDVLSHEEFNGYDVERICPCGASEKYKDCCLQREGVTTYHYQFVLANAPNGGGPSEIKRISTTKK